MGAALQFFDVLHTTVTDKLGRVLAQVGNIVGKTVTSTNVEWWNHVGFLSRPPKAEPGKTSARAVVVPCGQHDAIIASEDDRGLELAGNMKEGETIVYGAGETGAAQGRVIIKQDGSVTILTTDDNTKDGKSVYVRVKPDGIQIIAPWGKIVFDRTGFHVLHSSGASIDLGAIGGLPPPLDSFSSYARLTASAVDIKASTQSSGGGVGKKPLATFPELATALNAIQGQLDSIAVALTTNAAAWAALGGLTGPVLGAMVTPIAAPVAIPSTNAVGAVTTGSGVVKPLTNPATSPMAASTTASSAIG
jgi:hypothetical protein